MCVQIGVSRATRDLVGKLSELGWLFSQVQFFVHTRTNDSTAGPVERALYCGLLACVRVFVCACL